jgi:hypothetical protein
MRCFNSTFRRAFHRLRNLHLALLLRIMAQECLQSSWRFRAILQQAKSVMPGIGRHLPHGNGLTSPSGEIIVLAPRRRHWCCLPASLGLGDHAGTCRFCHCPVRLEATFCACCRLRRRPALLGKRKEDALGHIVSWAPRIIATMLRPRPTNDEVVGRPI